MKRSLNREILRLSIPAILSNVTIPLLGLTDTAITGHLGSKVFIASVAIGSLMFNVVFWLFGFLRMGTTGLTAQAYGAGGGERCEKVLSRAFFLGISLGLLLIAAQVPLQWLLLKIVSPPPAVAHLASEYYRICLWGAPALLGTMAITGWLIGMQNTVWPMAIAIATNVLNIVLSVLFVFPLGQGFKGVAYGSLLANILGLAIALSGARIFHRKPLRLRLSALLQGGNELKRFFQVNTDIFLRSGCMLLVSMACGALGARMGELVIAANAVVMNFFNFFSYFMDGFAFTGEALSGRFAGERNRAMLIKSVRYLLWWGAGCATLFLIIYLTACRSIVGFITDNREVIGYAMTLKTYIVLLPPLTVMAFMMDGFFIGLTATRRMLVVTAISSSAFFVVAFLHPESAAWIGTPSNQRLWAAFLTYLFMRGALLSCWAPATFKESINYQLR